MTKFTRIHKCCKSCRSNRIAKLDSFMTLSKSTKMKNQRTKRMRKLGFNLYSDQPQAHNWTPRDYFTVYRPSFHITREYDTTWCTTRIVNPHGANWGCLILINGESSAVQAIMLDLFGGIITQQNKRKSSNQSKQQKLSFLITSLVYIQCI